MSTRAVAALLCLVSLAASAQRAGALEGKKIAVLELKVGTGAKVQSPELLSDECRGAVAQVANPEGALVITRENMLEVLKATGGKCVEGECEVETARNLGVDLFVAGSVTLLDGDLVLSLKAYETRKGALLGQRRVSAPREKTLLDLVRPMTVELVREAFKLDKDRPTSAQVQPTVQLGSFGEPGTDVAVEQGETVVVRFESEPAGASVRLDGEFLCSAAPCSKRVSAGRHEVVFEKERYAAARLSGVAAKGALIRGTLQPKFGWLAIDTDESGISVTVDGTEVGKTPVVEREVDQGTVEVAVADGCYLRTGERLAIKAGEKRTLRLAAKPRIAGLKVIAVDEQGNDLEATVRVDGKPVGEAGTTLKVPLCSREVSVTLGGREWREPLKLEEGRTTTLTARPGREKSLGRLALPGGNGRPVQLDVTEVTVAAYAACVRAGKCTEPDTGTYCNWHEDGKEQHPINCVDWLQADAYCKAQGMRLPTGAELQFAASNGGRSQYPWGDAKPDSTRARWNSSGGTAPVGTHPAGATSSGIQDLSGNVWEWTAERGEVSGGSWSSNLEENLRASSRGRYDPSNRNYFFGFRCAQ